MHLHTPSCRDGTGMAQGWHSGESARLPQMCLGFDSQTLRHIWVEFVVGCLPCSERFFSGYSGFPLSSKTNISKFQFDLDYCQALYHEPLTRVIARALPVFDVKFTFIYLFYAPSCTFINLHTPSCTFIHIHTHCRHRSLLVRTTFPDPSCEDTLLHSSYPNHTWVFISLPVGLSNHLIEI